MNTEGTVLSLGSLELPRLEALIELMFLAAYADEQVTSEERELLKQRISEGSRGLISTITLDVMLETIENILAQDGREARFSSIRRRLGSTRLRLEALSLAAQVLWADRVIDPRETAWMARAAEAMEVPLEEAMKLLSPPETA